jgi:hypothetical protein
VLTFLSTPADNSLFALGSVDGHALQIDELKGTKPTEKINLSNRWLGVASAIIIASCIKENGVLKELKCAAARVFTFLSMPADNSLFALDSVDGHALQIDELKGTKPTEKIDLSNERLGVASTIIITSCIKENGVLKELKCAAARVFTFLSMSIGTLTLSPFPIPPLALSLRGNGLNFPFLLSKAKLVVKDAAGRGVRIIF